LTLSAAAQIHGVAPSVTSAGFGGKTTAGVPASVTSLGPHGFQPKNQFFNEPTCCINPLFPLNPNPPANRRHHRPGWGFPIAGSFYYPYSPAVVMQEPFDQEVEEPEDYSGGPTIFDRRGPGQSKSYDDYRERARVEEKPAPEPPAAEAMAQAEAAPVADQPSTVLVFKDGHQVEVQNYAVVGSMLIDLTPGHRRKIALTELDLMATAKQNDDRGIDFQMPAGSEAN